MQVIKTSFESTVHNVCANLVQEEMAGLGCRSVGAFISAPVYAVSARIVAAVAHTFWIGHEVILFLPRMIGISVGLAMSERASFTPSYFQRVGQVYGLYFKTMGAQFALGTMACVMPELSHYLLDLHKPLFSLQLETFIQTLPDLPHVQKEIRKSYGPIDSVIKLYRQLGLTDEIWRQALSMAILNTHSSDPKVAPEYLTTDSKAFQEAFKNTLIFYIATKLNQKMEKGEFSKELIEGLHPDIWRHMRDYLEPATQFRLIQLLKETIINHEVNPHFLYLYKYLTGFDYRPQEAVAVLRLLSQSMRASAVELVRANKFSADDIENYTALSAMTLDGIVRLLDGANLPAGQPETISFNGFTFDRDYHFFGAKNMLIETKQALLELNQQERTQLYRLCCEEEDLQVAAKVKSCFGLLQMVKIEIIDKKMNNTGLDAESSVDWAAAFDLG